MKKVLFVFAVLLMAGIGNAVAQSLNGTWKVDQEFKNQLGFTDNDGTETDILLVFNGSNIDVKMLVKSEDPEVGVLLMSYTIPGTFKKSSKTYTATFDQKKEEFKVEDMESSNPEMKELMKDAETKKMILSMVEDGIKKDSGSGEVIGKMHEISRLFLQFEVSSVDSKKLVLNFADEFSIGLDRQ